MSSVESGTAQGRVAQHHGSSTSINSGGAISSGDSVFMDRSSPQELTSTTMLRSKSTSPDSCVPDSTTAHIASPFSVQQNAKMNRSSCTESSDLGYRSGSSSSLSLRDRLTSGVSCGPSPMTRTDSNASSIISDNPLSANSSVGSLHPPHASVASAAGPEFHSNSTVHQGNSFGSGNVMGMPSANASYQLAPASDIQYVQNQPISSSNSNTSFPLMHQQQMGSQFMPSPQLGAVQMTMDVNGVPQQFVQQSNLPMNGVGVDPINSLPDWTPAPTVSDFNPSSSAVTFSALSMGYSNSGGVVGGIPPQQQQQGTDPIFSLQTTGGPGFQYITTSLSGASVSQEFYNPAPIAVSGSSMFNGSAAGMNKVC